MMPVPWKLYESSCKWVAVYQTLAYAPNNGVSELRVIARSEVSWAQRISETGRTYAFNPRPGAIPTGKLAQRPMRKEHSAATAAVVVIRSRRTSSTQARYTSSLTQPSLVGQTHVPPESERMEALTEI